MNQDQKMIHKAQGRTWQDVAMAPSSSAARMLEANVLACFTTRTALPLPFNDKPVGKH